MHHPEPRPGVEAGGALLAGCRAFSAAHLPASKPALSEALGIGGEMGESLWAVFTAPHGTAQSSRLPGATGWDNHTALGGLAEMVQGQA